MKPNFSEEKKLWKTGYKCIVGLDEAGRGPLAGPVVAGAVTLNFQFSISNFQSIINDPIFKQIKDSKLLASGKREEIYKKLIKNKNIKWGIGIVSEKVIDKINILEATKLAMSKAIANLKSQIPMTKPQNYFLILDGNFSIKSEIPQKAIVKADQKVFSVAAASIIAKVTRDRLMQKYHKKYPQYGFNRHKGYGTKAHFANLEKFGPCKIHRKNFWPIKTFQIPNPNVQCPIKF